MIELTLEDVIVRVDPHDPAKIAAISHTRMPHRGRPSRVRRRAVTVHVRRRGSHRDAVATATPPTASRTARGLSGAASSARWQDKQTRTSGTGSFRPCRTRPPQTLVPGRQIGAHVAAATRDCDAGG